MAATVYDFYAVKCVCSTEETANIWILGFEILSLASLSLYKAQAWRGWRMKGMDWLVGVWFCTVPSQQPSGQLTRVSVLLCIMRTKKEWQE